MEYKATTFVHTLVHINADYIFERMLKYQILKDANNLIGRHVSTLLEELQEDFFISMKIPGLKSFTGT